MSATRRPRSRRGIALILAIVVLAALLLLGLPFLVSQSSALTSIRSFRSAEQAGSTTDSALRIGMAVATTAMEDHLRPVATNDPAPSAFTLLTTRQSAYVAPAKPEDKPVYDSGWLPPFTVQVDELNQALPIYSVRLDRLLPQAFGRVPIDATTTGGAPAHRQLASIAIEDESGKLDPNTMSPAAWDALIRKVLPGADWDDNEVVCSRCVQQWAVGASQGGDFVQNNDVDTFGELASALAELPHRLPAHRITDIDQLLLADPGHNQIPTPSDFHYPSPVAPPGSFGLRRPLTRSELDRLRPFLTLYQTPPGRQGLIDFGTVVTVDNTSGTDQVVWDTPGWLERIYGLGTSLRCEAPDASIGEGWLTMRGNEWYMSSAGQSPTTFTAGAMHAQPVVNLNAASATVRAVLSADPDPKMAVEAKSASSLAALSGIKAGTSILNDNGQTQPPALQLTAWHLQDPVRVLLRLGTTANISLPPVGTAGCGVFTIAAAAAVTDGTGRQEASRMRRQVVQALPQEHQLERRWNLQSEMHSLVAQHFTSNVDSWPNPVNRVFSNDASLKRAWPAVDPAAANADADELHGFRPRTLPSWATNLTVPWFDWAMDFGAALPLRTTYVLGARTPQGVVLGENLGGGTTLPTGTTVVGGTPQATNANHYGLDDLLPDGLRIRGGGSDDGRLLALPLQGDPTNGVLHRSNRQVTVWSEAKSPTPPNQRSFDLDARHISLWMRPESEWARVGFVPIFETRIPLANAVGEITTGADGRIAVSGAADPATANGAQQNRLSLYYDANQELLVVIVAPPTVPHTRDAGPWIGWDDPLTPNVDERSLGFGYGPALPGNPYNALYDKTANPPWLLAPNSLPDWTGSSSPALWRITQLSRPNRILHLFSTRPPGDLTGKSLTDRCHFKKGRWHHIQFVMGSNRPGGMALIVDEVCGQDVLAGNRGTCSIVSFGDQATLPAVVLDQGLEATAVAKAADLQQKTIAVRPFTCHGNSITAQDLFPKRGMLRIGSEYILYQEVTAAGFSGCVRGQRQDTNTGSLGDGHWPVLTAHDPGALVVPGGYRVDAGISPGNVSPPCGRLYKGGCTLADELTNGDTYRRNFTIYATLPAMVAGPISRVGVSTTWALSLPDAEAVIPLAAPGDDTPGVPDQFPAGGGIVKLGKGDFRPYCFYRTCEADPQTGGMRLTGVKRLDASWGIVPHKNDFITSGIGTTYTFQAGEDSDRVYLVSIRVTGTDPGVVGLYPQETDLSEPSTQWKSSPTPEDPQRLVPILDTNGNPIPALPNYRNLIQIMHPDSGRIEWIWYRAIVTAPTSIKDATGNTPYFFITNLNGWMDNYGSLALDLPTGERNTGRINYSNRGMMRTDFVGKAADQTHLTATDTFPAGSPVLPVQTAASDAGLGHMLTTGDVVTLIPKAQMSMSSPDRLGRPLQAVVRYAASDGYRPALDGYKDGDSDYFNDAKNGYFAFAHQLPETIDNLSNYEVLCGPCWSAPRDLSPLGPLPASALLSNAPPRVDALADGYTPGGEGSRLIIAGSDNPRRNAADGVQRNADCTVDAIAAGPIPGASSDPAASCRVAAWLLPDGETPTVLSDAKGLPCIIATETPLFFNGLPDIGLLRIGGEVFAYQKIGNTSQVRLIGRGLLGSLPIPHLTGEYILPLPNGPVATLDGSLTDPQFRFENQPFAPDVEGVVRSPNTGFAINTPALLISDPYGTSCEVLMAYGGQARRTPADQLVPNPVLPVGVTVPDKNNPAHWLNYTQISYSAADWTRGLYNTTHQDWSGKGADLRPIVIGWWPRYPSALPNHSDDDLKARMLRSRAYAWVGFPHGFRNAWFWPALLRRKSDDPTGHLLEDESLASIAMPASSAIFNAEIRALSEGLDWSQSTPVVLGLGTLQERKLAKEPFDNAKQFGHPVDGAELRVHWRYAKPPRSGDSAGLDQLLDIAENAGTAPVLGAVSLRCLAPSQVLATEPAR